MLSSCLLSQQISVTRWWNIVLLCHIHTIHKYEVVPGFCSSMPFVLAHKTQSPFRCCLSQTMEKSKPVTVHCIVNGNRNQLSELHGWLLNCLWHSFIWNYNVSIICSTMLFRAYWGNCPCHKIDESFVCQKDRDLVNEKRWVFNLCGIVGRARWGGIWIWGEHIVAQLFDVNKCLEKGAAVLYRPKIDLHPCIKLAL